MKGLFLDLDGTLADSLALLRGVYDEFLRQFGCTGSAAEFQDLIGPPIPVVVARLQEAHRLPGAAEELVARYHALIAKVHGAAPPAEGAREVLERAQERSWTVAVVTSATRAEASAWLARAGLAPFVATIIGGDEVSRGKPDPEPYRLALERTGCDAPSSLAIEDSTAGAHAAMAAGLPTWLLHGPEPRKGDAAPALLRGCLPDLRAALTLL